MPTALRKPRNLTPARAFAIAIALLLPVVWWRTFPLNHTTGITYKAPFGNDVALLLYQGKILLYRSNPSRTVPATSHFEAVSLERDEIRAQTPSSQFRLAITSGMLHGHGINWQCLGFRLSYWENWENSDPRIVCSDREPYPTVYAAECPFWAPELATLLLLANAARRERRLRKSTTATLCLTCNYDLRASPTTCPECGTPRRINPTEPVA